MTNTFLLLLWSLFAICSADIQVQQPTAGSTNAAGRLEVQWNKIDSGISLDDLQGCQLLLCAGGNKPTGYLPLAQLDALKAPYHPGVSQTYTFDTGLGADVHNAYFIQFLCALPTGNVHYFSDRFSLSGMTGIFPTNINEALLSVAGTNGPDTINNYAGKEGTTSEPTDSSKSLAASPTAYTTYTSLSEHTLQSTNQGTVVQSTQTSFATVTITDSNVYSSLAQAQTPTSSTTGTSDASAPTLSDSGSDSDDGPPGSDLTASGTAAIAISVIFFLFIVCTLAFCIFRRRRRQREFRFQRHSMSPDSMFGGKYSGSTHAPSPFLPPSMSSPPPIPMSKRNSSGSQVYSYGLAGIRYSGSTNRSNFDLPTAPSPAASPSPRTVVYGAKFPLPTELSDPCFYEGKPSTQGWFQRAELETRDCVVIAEMEEVMDFTAGCKTDRASSRATSRAGSGRWSGLGSNRVDSVISSRNGSSLGFAKKW